MRTVLASVASLALILALFAMKAETQSDESEPAPPQGGFQPAPVPTQEKPLIPDVPPSITDKTQVNEKWFTFKLGLSVVIDYSAFRQDTESVSQVGVQDDQWQARDLRLIFRGTVGGGYKVNYFIAGVYRGFDTDPDNLWDIVDLNFTFPIRDQGTKLTFGKSKETFDYEMTGDSGNLPQQERVTNPFFVSRDIGFKISHVFGADHRMLLSAGIFNDWFVTGEELKNSGNDFTARFTGLAWDHPDNNSYMHVGIAARYAGADNGSIRYKGRPESNVTVNYVDTGNIPADHAWHMGLEALWGHGPYSLLAEYDHAWVDSHVDANPQFNGYYITGSWVLTGEARPYDRTVGYARRVLPTGRWGAPELVARFSHIDLDDKTVLGGTYDKTYLGINWWATRRWKFGFGWGRTRLNRFDLIGITNSYLTRIQWVF